MKDIKDESIEGLIKEYEKANGIMEDCEAMIKVIKDEIGDRLREMKISGTKAGGFYMTLAHRFVFTDVKMSDAEELGCIKQSMDTIKLGSLAKKGIKINGIKSIEYLLIKRETTA